MKKIMDSLAAENVQLKTKVTLLQQMVGTLTKEKKEMTRRIDDTFKEVLRVGACDCCCFFLVLLSD
jgi:hypothetical protein